MTFSLHRGGVVMSSQVLHLKNIHFPSLSTSHTPMPLLGTTPLVQLPSYRHFLDFIPNPLLIRTLFSAPQALYSSLEMYRVFASASADNPHCFNIRIHIRIRGCG